MDKILPLLQDGKTGQVKSILIDDPKLFEQKDSTGRVLLHWICSFGVAELVPYVLERAKLSIDLEDDAGWTPLMIACSAGHVEIVKVLIGLTADVNAINNNGQSCLHYAASKGRDEIVKLLLSHGAYLNVQDRYGHSPLHRAASQGHTKVVEILVKTKGIDVNVPDKQRNTPLHFACEENRQPDAVLLVSNGARVDFLNNEEKAPLDLAQPDLRKSLLRYRSENG